MYRHNKITNSKAVFIACCLAIGLGNLLTPERAIANPLPAPEAAFFTPTNLTPLPVSAVTGEKPQSKVWWHANSWWAVLPSTAVRPAGTWLWRLEGTAWTKVLQLSAETGTKADVKPTGNLAHILLYDSSPELVSVEFTGTTYQLWSERLTAAPITLPNSETATIEVDTSGRMWLATEAGTSIIAYYSDAPYTSWSSPITLAAGIKNDDISVVTTLPAVPGLGLPARIGVLWSNQNTRRFGFRTHNDGDNPSTWSTDEVPASQSALDIGLGMADDHLNVAVASNGSLYAAVKTSYDTPSDPKIALLVRRPNGTWDDLYPVDTIGTRGIVLLDQAETTVTVIYTASESGGSILYKESPLSSISFGPSQVLMSGTLNNPTSTKQNYGADVVVLASGSSSASGVLVPAQIDNIAADLSISKTDNLDTIAPQDRLTYTIIAANTGQVPVNGAMVADNIPTSLVDVTWTCTSLGGATCTSSGSGDISDTVDLPIGASVNYTLSARVDSEASGLLSNTASVILPTGFTDTNPANNSATDTTPISTNVHLPMNIYLPMVSHGLYPHP